MIALFPGSFDPVTLGHIDILNRATKTFDQIIVAVLCNSSKAPLFTIEERVGMLKETTKDIPGVQVESYVGLHAEFAKKRGARHILRGVRTAADCGYEIPMAQANKQLAEDIETIILVSAPAYGYMSSGLIREIAITGYASGFDDIVLDQWVPPAVKDMLRSKLLD